MPAEANGEVEKHRVDSQESLGRAQFCSYLQNLPGFSFVKQEHCVTLMISPLYIPEPE